MFHQFQKATGLSLMEGFGQSETTVMIGNLVGMRPKPGSMGKPVPLYPVDLVDHDGNSVADGQVGEIVIRAEKTDICGLFRGYYNNPEGTDAAWHDGLYHTGDTAWRDEDGYFWYVAGWTTSSSPAATASAPSRSRASSWSCPTSWSAASPPLPTPSGARWSRPASSWSPAPRAPTR